jgi:hypothetical protein
MSIVGHADGNYGRREWFRSDGILCSYFNKNNGKSRLLIISMPPQFTNWQSEEKKRYTKKPFVVRKSMNYLNCKNNIKEDIRGKERT